MKEQLHFTYDMEYVISLGAQIYIEKILYGQKFKNEEELLLNKKPYSIRDLKLAYGEERTSKTFDKKIVNMAVEIWEKGTTITDQHFRQLAIKYLNSITRYETYHLGDENGFVSDENELIRIYVKMCDHYDAAIYLAVRFIGGPNKLKDMENVKDLLCNYILRYISISSDTTSATSVVSDLRSGFTSISFIQDRFEEMDRKLKKHIEYLTRKKLEA